MDQSSGAHTPNVSIIFAISFGIIGLILIALIIFFCRRNKNHKHRSKSNSIQSFQQLYFSKNSSNPIKTSEQPIIQRWSSLDQPSITVYRISTEDKSNDIYQPVTEERLRSSIEQSKAMEYIGLEINFF